MLRGSRPFIRVVVQLCKIVMRGRIPRGKGDKAASDENRGPNF